MYEQHKLLPNRYFKKVTNKGSNYRCVEYLDINISFCIIERKSKLIYVLKNPLSVTQRPATC